MLNKILFRYSSVIFITAILLTYFLPNFSSIDRIGNQWLYLSLINLIGFVLIITKYNLDFKLSYFVNNYMLRWYLLFLLSGIISFLSSVNLIESIFTFNQYLNSFIALFLIYFFLKRISSPEKFVGQLFLTLLLIEIYFSFSPILKDISLGNLQFRSMSYSGLAANINITSFSIVFKIPILLYFITKSKRALFRILLSITLTVALFVVYVLGSRSALLGLLISFLFFFFSLIKNNENFKKNITSILLVIIPLIFSVIFNLLSNTGKKNSSVIDRASTISFSTNDGSVNQRLRYYKHGLDQFLKSPFLGVGIGNWKLKSIEYDKEDILGYTVPYHAHNDFIQILAEQGILGFVFYLMVFLSFMYVFLKYDLHSNNNFYFFIAASFFIFLIDSNLNFPIARPISIIQFAVILSLVSLKQSEKK